MLLRRRTPSFEPPTTTSTVPAVVPHPAASEARPAAAAVSAMALPVPASQPYKLARINVTDLTVHVPGSGAVGRSAVVPERKPLWRTREFALYYVAFAVVVPLMIWVPVHLSSTTHPNYARYAPRLSPGWFGRQVDNSDPQYRSFRSNLAPLMALAAVHLGLAQIVRRWFPATASTPASASSAVRARTYFVAAFAVTMIVALHGSGAFKILVILGVNYAAAVMPKGRWASAWPAMVVIGNMGILFFNERSEGWRLGRLHAALGTLDEFGGLLPRWHVGFNITMLRIVSFALDVHWATPAMVEPADHRARVTHSPPTPRSFVLYLAYTLYPPLYVAGPIMTYNDFVHQLARPLSLSLRDKMAYAARFVACVATMEIVLHAMWIVAIKDAGAWQGLGPADMCLVGFWNLVVVWLKLLIPWRFFRLWALLDGVDPPENMIRCVANNYSTLGFWRSWHRSYNQWLLRYIYIPLGGARNVVVSTLLVFTFVALWHDLSFRLLAWGWLVSLFVLPELAARRLVPASYADRPWYRHVCAAGGVANIAMLMAANLVGFVMGLDGVGRLGAELVGSVKGWAFMGFSAACLFVAVQVMMEYREEERRRGIDRKC